MDLIIGSSRISRVAGGFVDLDPSTITGGGNSRAFLVLFVTVPGVLLLRGDKDPKSTVTLLVPEALVQGEDDNVLVARDHPPLEESLLNSRSFLAFHFLFKEEVLIVIVIMKCTWKHCYHTI